MNNTDQAGVKFSGQIKSCSIAGRMINGDIDITAISSVLVRKGVVASEEQMLDALRDVRNMVEGVQSFTLHFEDHVVFNLGKVTLPGHLLQDRVFIKSEEESPDESEDESSVEPEEGPTIAFRKFSSVVFWAAKFMQRQNPLNLKSLYRATSALLEELAAEWGRSVDELSKMRLESGFYSMQGVALPAWDREMFLGQGRFKVGLGQVIISEEDAKRLGVSNEEYSLFTGYPITRIIPVQVLISTDWPKGCIGASGYEVSFGEKQHPHWNNVSSLFTLCGRDTDGDVVYLFGKEREDPFFQNRLHDMWLNFWEGGHFINASEGLEPKSPANRGEVKSLSEAEIESLFADKLMQKVAIPSATVTPQLLYEAKKHGLLGSVTFEEIRAAVEISIETAMDMKQGTGQDPLLLARWLSDPEMGLEDYAEDFESQGYDMSTLRKIESDCEKAAMMCLDKCDTKVQRSNWTALVLGTVLTCNAEEVGILRAAKAKFGSASSTGKLVGIMNEQLDPVEFAKAILGTTGIERNPACLQLQRKGFEKSAIAQSKLSMIGKPLTISESEEGLIVECGLGNVVINIDDNGDIDIDGIKVVKRPVCLVGYRLKNADREVVSTKMYYDRTSCSYTLSEISSIPVILDDASVRASILIDWSSIIRGMWKTFYTYPEYNIRRLEDEAEASAELLRQLKHLARRMLKDEPISGGVWAFNAMHHQIKVVYKPLSIPGAAMNPEFARATLQIRNAAATVLLKHGFILSKNATSVGDPGSKFYSVLDNGLTFVTQFDPLGRFIPAKREGVFNAASNWVDLQNPFSSYRLSDVEASVAAPVREGWACAINGLGDGAVILSEEFASTMIDSKGNRVQSGDKVRALMDIKGSAFVVKTEDMPIISFSNGLKVRADICFDLGQGAIKHQTLVHDCVALAFNAAQKVAYNGEVRTIERPSSLKAAIDAAMSSGLYKDRMLTAEILTPNGEPLITGPAGVVQLGLHSQRVSTLGRTFGPRKKRLEPASSFENAGMSMSLAGTYSLLALGYSMEETVEFCRVSEDAKDKMSQLNKSVVLTELYPYTSWARADNPDREAWDGLRELAFLGRAKELYLDKPNRELLEWAVFEFHSKYSEDYPVYGERLGSIKNHARQLIWGIHPHGNYDIVVLFAMSAKKPTYRDLNGTLYAGVNEIPTKLLRSIRAKAVLIASSELAQFGEKEEVKAELAKLGSKLFVLKSADGKCYQSAISLVQKELGITPDDPAPTL